MGLQIDVRDFASRFTRDEILIDSGRPKTPRKGGILTFEVVPPGGIEIFRDRSVAAIVPGGGPDLTQIAQAPIADSVGFLSAGDDMLSAEQAIELSSVMIKVDRKTRPSVRLTDFRKQLMVMGLFPPPLYEVGESFEEIHLRYELYDPMQRLCKTFPLDSRWSADNTRSQ